MTVMKSFLNSKDVAWIKVGKGLLRLSPVLVITFWLVFFGLITHYFSNITLESERRDNLFKQQPELSFLRTVDDHGHISSLSQLANDQHKVLIAEFIYTQCRALCLSLGNTFQQAQTQIIERKLTQQLGLVSISFDIVNENTKTLQAYRQRMYADPQVWSLLKMQNVQVLDAVKRKLGLMVIEDQQKDFVHNSAFLVISPQGHLVGIFDPAEIGGAIELALKTWQVKQKYTVN